MMPFMAGFLLRRLFVARNHHASDCFFRVVVTRTLSSSNTGSNSNEWTQLVDYLDESGSLISSSPGARPVLPGSDPTVLSGSVSSPVPQPAAAARIATLALRHRWGPDLDSRLDALPTTPDAPTLHLALLSLPPDPVPSLSLYRWARRQPWWAPSDPLFSHLISRLSSSSSSSSPPDDIISLLEDILKSPNLIDLTDSINYALQSLADAQQLETSYSWFKKISKAGFSKFSSSTFRSMISLFLNKGLPFKAFEIYQTMGECGCVLDFETYELLIPALARTGRLDAAKKLFDEMQEKGFKAGFGAYSVLVDAMGKAGRLDAAMALYREMQSCGHRPSGAMNASMVEAMVRAGKLDAGMKLWDEMKGRGFRPSFGLYTMVVEANAKSGRLEKAAEVFVEMEKAGFFPTAATYACLIEMHSSAGQVDAAMKLYYSMANSGARPGLNTFTSLLTVLAKNKLLDLAAKVLLEMKASGFSVEVCASDLLMVYIKEGSPETALKWLQFMGSAGIRTNNFIIRQLFESCMKTGMFESARPLLETYVGAAAKVDLVLYTSILAHLVRCRNEKDERLIMDVLGTTKHKAHEFMCGLFTGTEQRKKPVLSFVREFFQGVDYDAEENAVRYFVNVLLNYLVLMGQINRARCVWKVAYENKLFPKAIVFDQHIAWSLDVRNLSVGAAMVAVVHTLHRFRKRMLYYGVVPRRIKLVTGPTLKMVLAEVLASLDSPFEVSKVVLRAPGESVLEWFKRPIVQQFLLNEIPSKADVLMHKLNVLFPSSSPEVRSQSPVKSFGSTAR